MNRDTIRAKMKLMMKTAHGPRMAYNIIKQGHVKMTPLASALLIGVMGEHRPFLSEMMLEIAHAKEVPWMIRHQVAIGMIALSTDQLSSRLWPVYSNCSATSTCSARGFG